MSSKDLTYPGGLRELSERYNSRRTPFEFGDEDLPGRVGEMFFGANDMRDPEVVIVDHACQVIQRTAIGAGDHVVLLGGPSDRDRPTNQVFDDTFTFSRHLQPDRRDPAFGLIGLRLLVVGSHPAPIVEESLATFFTADPSQPDFSYLWTP